MPYTVQVTDDTGFLALVDPDAYETLIEEDWSREQLFAHFQAQMEAKRLLIWRTGSENTWRVQVWLSKFAGSGLREVTGPIVATRGRLLLTNYESLTMVAQFRDEKLPQVHEEDQVIDGRSGEYCCRIIQMGDGGSYQPSREAPEFIVELLYGTSLPPWSHLPWTGV